MNESKGKSTFPGSDDPSPRSGDRSRLRIRVGLFITLFGLFVFLLGTKPGWFHLQRSSTVGFVKISVFLVGLAIICLGGYISMLELWKGMELSIVGDIGLRLVATGYVIAVFSGMADVFGLGSQTYPQIPFFGPVQALGGLLGEIVIGIGFLLLVPFSSYHRK
ncbi:MAG: hypothetical protein WCA79_09665 [Anaerolineales bacterium]